MSCERKRDAVMPLGGSERLPKRPSLPKRVLAYLRQRPRELCSLAEISRACRGKELEASFERYFRFRLVPNLRAEQKSHIYFVRGVGACLFSEEPLTSASLTLRDLGVSLYPGGEDGRRVIEGLSVLTPEIWENPLICPEDIVSLLDSLDLAGNQTDRFPFLTPHVPPVERRVLSALAKGGLYSPAEHELFGASRKALPVLIHRLRKIVAAVDHEIVYRKSGYLLKRKGLDLDLYLPALPKKSPPEFPSQTKERRTTNPQRLMLLLQEKEGDNLVVTYQEIWERIWGTAFAGDGEQKTLIRHTAFRARKMISVAFPDWSLLAVYNYSCFCFCRPEPGSFVPLAELYDLHHVPADYQDWLYNVLGGTVSQDGKRIAALLSPLEAKILLKLARAEGRTVSLDALISFLENSLVSQAQNPTGLLRAEICHLRRKLEKWKSSLVISSQSGIGYSLEPKPVLPLNPT